MSLVSVLLFFFLFSLTIENTVGYYGSDSDSSEYDNYGCVELGVESDCIDNEECRDLIIDGLSGNFNIQGPYGGDGSGIGATSDFYTPGPNNVAGIVTGIAVYSGAENGYIYAVQFHFGYGDFGYWDYIHAGSGFDSRYQQGEIIVDEFLCNDDEYVFGVKVRTGWWYDAIQVLTNQRSSSMFGGEGGDISPLITHQTSPLVGVHIEVESVVVRMTFTFGGFALTNDLDDLDDADNDFCWCYQGDDSGELWIPVEGALCKMRKTHGNECTSNEECISNLCLGGRCCIDGNGCSDLSADNGCYSCSSESGECMLGSDDASTSTLYMPEDASCLPPVSTSLCSGTCTVSGICDTRSGFDSVCNASAGYACIADTFQCELVSAAVSPGSSSSSNSKDATSNSKDATSNSKDAKMTSEEILGICSGVIGSMIVLMFVRKRVMMSHAQADSPSVPPMQMEPYTIQVQRAAPVQVTPPVVYDMPPGPDINGLVLENKINLTNRFSQPPPSYEEAVNHVTIHPQGVYEGEYI